MAGNKVIGEKNKSENQKRIINQWKAFSQTEAFKDLMEYADAHRDMMLRYAEELEMPSPGGKGMMPISGEVANYLLQNRRGVGIITSYIRLRLQDQ